MVHRIHIILDDECMDPANPPYHTNFMRTENWVFLPKKLKKVIMDKLKESD